MSTNPYDPAGETELHELHAQVTGQPTADEEYLTEFDRDQEQAQSRFAATILRRSQLATLPPIEPLIDGVLSLRTAAVLFGPTGAGKTFLALGWACCVGTGHPWLGREVLRVPTLYVVGEGSFGLNDRVAAWEYAWQTKVTDDDVIFSAKPDSFSDMTVWAELRAEAKSLGVRFVVLDTFSSLAPDADETRDAPTFTRRLSDLATAIDGTALAVHHPGWSDSERARGGYQLEANVDEVLRLTGSAANDIVELTRKKVKEGRSGERMWLRRNTINLGLDEHGREHSSIIIVAATKSERQALVADAAADVVREVFAGALEPFSLPQIRDTLKERLEYGRSTAYQHANRLVSSGLLQQEGGTEKRPKYKLADHE